MNIKSNVVTHYYYMVLFLLLFITYNVTQYLGIRDGDYNTVGLIIAVIIEIALLMGFVMLINNFHVVTASKKGIKLKKGIQIRWEEVSSVKKIPLMDLYIIELKSKKLFLFVGDRFPLGVFGIFFQDNQMYQLICVVKKLYNI
jgi:hypothetical protein